MVRSVTQGTEYEDFKIYHLENKSRTRSKYMFVYMDKHIEVIFDHHRNEFITSLSE